MIKIYEIPKEKLSELKKILEAEDKPAEELGVEIESKKGKETVREKAMRWQVNEFKKQGYLLRDAKALSIKSEGSFLYISASDDFFERNEKILLDIGVRVLKGKELEDVKVKIEGAEEEAASGIGSIFG